MQKIKNPFWLFVFSALIATVPIFGYQYLHQTIQAGTCAVDDVSPYVFWEPWGYNARCTDGSSNENLFELSGLFLVGTAFSITVLSLIKGNKIVIIASSAVGINQFSEVWIQSQAGYMFSNFYTILPALHIVLTLGSVYLVYQIIMARPNFKLNLNYKYPMVSMEFFLISSLFFSTYFFTYPSDPIPMSFFIIGSSVLFFRFFNIYLDGKWKIFSVPWYRNSFNKLNIVKPSHVLNVF